MPLDHTHSQPNNVFFIALRDSFPIAMGYIPLGAAYGLLFVNAGMDWYWAALMSLFVYTGALQFLSANFLALGMPIWEIALTTLIINFRHIFYGLSYPFEKLSHPLTKLYGIFALTDETYSLLASKDREKLSEKQIMFIQSLNQTYWIIGTLIGAVASTFIPSSIDGIEFALTALFVVLMQEHCYKKENYPYLAIAAFSSACAFAITQTQFLSVAMGLFVLSLAIQYKRVSK